MGNDDDHATPVSVDVSTALSAHIERAAERARALRLWQRRMVAELSELPNSLANMRTGAQNFELVGRRLADVSETLEEVTRLYSSTVADTTRRTASAAEAMRKQIDALSAQSPERMKSAVSEIQDTVESLSRLNPFWPRQDRSRDD